MWVWLLGIGWIWLFCASLPEILGHRLTFVRILCKPTVLHVAALRVAEKQLPLVAKQPQCGAVSVLYSIARNNRTPR